MRRFGLAVGVALLALLASSGADAAKKKARPTPAATPTPTPLPFLRAAGACLYFVPGKHLVLAEVGTTGRVFRVDSTTRIETKIRAGARLRIIYVEAPDGPLARRVLPGPVVEKPASGAGKN